MHASHHLKLFSAMVHAQTSQDQHPQEDNQKFSGMKVQAEKVTFLATSKENKEKNEEEQER